MKLVKTFDEKYNFNNAIIALSLDIDEAIFIYHHAIDNELLSRTKEIIKKHKDIEVKSLYIKDEDKQLDDLLDDNTIVDVSVSKYITLCLFDKASKKNLDIVYYSKENGSIRYYNNRNKSIDKIYCLDAQDIIYLGGGYIKSAMHRSVDMARVDTIKIIKDSVNNNLYKYSSFVSYINYINMYTSKNKSDSLEYKLIDEVKAKIKSNPLYKTCNELFNIEDDKLIYRNHLIKEYFGASGSFLEAYVYIALKESNYFDDVKMSCKIDYNKYYGKYPIDCEIDIIVSKNNHIVFLSCKSNNVDAKDLYEIKIHKDILGNSLSSAVICTINDISSSAPSIYLKAKELKIPVIDQTAFKQNKVADIVLDVINKKYTYERV